MGTNIIPLNDKDNGWWTCTHMPLQLNITERKTEYDTMNQNKNPSDTFSHAPTGGDRNIYLVVLLYHERLFLTEHLEQREGRRANSLIYNLRDMSYVSATTRASDFSQTFMSNHQRILLTDWLEESQCLTARGKDSTMRFTYFTPSATLQHPQSQVGHRSIHLLDGNRQPLISFPLSVKCNGIGRLYVNPNSDLRGLVISAGFWHGSLAHSETQLCLSRS